MKHIRKYNESSDFKNSNHDIEEFFINYHDNEKLRIEDHYVLNGEVIKATPYMKDTSKYKKCKIITIELDKPNGINIWNQKAITDLDMLSQVVHDIKSFYDFMEEEINYTIVNDFSGLSIKFLTLGGEATKEESNASDIDDWMKRLKIVYDARGYKRINIKGNWFEILIPLTGGKRNADDTTMSIGVILGKIGRAEINLDTPNYERYHEVINIRNEAWAKGLKFHVGFYDRQIILKFDKR